MSYAIMRCKKLATMGSVASSLQHAYRERETANADPQRTGENEHTAASSTSEAMGKLRELLPEKRRKDAVLAVEYVLTASPDWWKTASQAEQAKFFDQARGWLAEKYGADRIVTASIHRDETSPHMTAFVVPLTKDGRLSAKDFIGNKAQMTRDQTTFAAAVADLGLHRGIEGSKARHTRIQAFYEALERPEITHKTITPDLASPKVLKKGVLGIGQELETPEQVAQRLTSSMRAAYDPAITAAAGSREMRRKALEAQETARDLRDRLKPVLDALQPLTEANREKVGRVFMAVGEKALAEQEEGKRKAGLDAEKRRRIGALPTLERRTAGAAHTFAQHARAALAQAGGDASRVEWAKVEGAAAREAISQHGQAPEKVARAICEHSPTRSNPASHAKVTAWVQEKAPAWQQQYEAQHGHSKGQDGPSHDR